MIAFTINVFPRNEKKRLSLLMKITKPLVSTAFKYIL
jgi:hypothetical protein